ncbi:MAG TPA: diadenylate cyclase [Methanocorpusculum sp.]|nr:diadenylate cyclase [Methanocorpusculum sp.]
MSEKNCILLEAADVLAEEVDAVSIISFLPKEEGLKLKTPVINVLDINPELIREHSMLALMDYCSSHVVDAVVQYRILTKKDSGTVIAVFPYAMLIYDLDNTNDTYNVDEFRDIVDPGVIHTILRIALEIAHDGREGRAVGTAFIIGDIDELKRWSHQGVLNPYEGHPAEVRNLMNEENWESVKEFSQLDGVFLVDQNGVVACSGRYLDADSRDVNLQSGLGGRHLAVAAITKVTKSVGIVVSESGGVVRIFVNGKIITHIRTDLRLIF